MPLTATQLAALRREYSQHPLRREDLHADPIVQFNHWLAVAFEKDLLEPNAMVLATVDAEGQPWSRTVLLKQCDQRGFTFFTNYRSSKGKQLAANPRVSVTFCWVALERQVNITGTVSQTSAQESEIYFHSRPLSSQHGAWASEQSTVVAARDQLEQQFAEAAQRYGEQVPLPPFWGGYLLRPQTIEFWQGQRSRLHDRLRYQRLPDNSWVIERLSP